MRPPARATSRAARSTPVCAPDQISRTSILGILRGQASDGVQTAPCRMELKGPFHQASGKSGFTLPLPAKPVHLPAVHVKIVNLRPEPLDHLDARWFERIGQESHIESIGSL